jgi:hypothetical protein
MVFYQQVKRYCRAADTEIVGRGCGESGMAAWKTTRKYLGNLRIAEPDAQRHT